ncbi:MAG: cell division protein FtsK [Candidatus Harrisonbacteria bacterium CG10_big_fil_rev_8_21_14_0_10_40_38]|uniref:Cell division protein FtsK n=1 Tax=Candidatus Harrisonbacteria bacterium CG10_big_fil_rev_8_21_14_0_10_40_38 TaxID=1974583 RepID=A0A2H0URB0_9BACT|nr:MAG: cell division protein FtsK [Candidatus Harrisonbacteria bacterium CG10_big_fil_rev_8_21_14_0_10_40_38]
MAKRNKKEEEEEEGEGFLSQIKTETKKSVSAVLLIAVSALLVLASIEKAGPVGDAIFSGFSKVFGIGYYLIPIACFAVGVLFLSTLEKRFFSASFIGAGSFILLVLGLIDIFAPSKGGWLGNVVGSLETPFGVIAATIIIMALALAAFLLTFNVSVKLPKLSLGREDVVEEEEESEEEDNDEEGDIEEEGEEEEESEEEDNDEEGESALGSIKKFVKGMVSGEPAEAGPINTKRKTSIITSENYVPPPFSLLKSTIEKPTSGDLRANANIIKRTLDSFGIPVEMGEISIGPKVTRYTLKPAEGVKLSRITALSQDLALALAAHPIRFEAPIPGKSLVGVEVPNKAAAIVRLGSLMTYSDFTDSSSKPLMLPLGRDVSGEPIFINLEKMPHLLIAGSTGSGKSICIHSIIMSLLYKNSPEQLQLILIDPKRVELSAYDGIPHLVSPVITDVKKSVGVFRWTISEMDRRYDLLLKAGSRDIRSYNAAHKDEPIPYLVMVIDELADLMARYGREVEGSIVRLAQMARATGIHLILSTQRPSVEVITGLIKANITARIALQVASQIDSRTILDTSGAEKLLGGGDLLFISSDYSKPKRVQGAYISEEEIKSVTDFIVENNPTQREESIDGEIEEATEDSSPDIFSDFEDSDDGDELYNEAVSVVREAQKASASFLQRRLKVGYARAARLLDLMEEKGVIGPGEGAKPREVFIDQEEQ